METTGYIVAVISVIIISLFVYRWFKPSKKVSGGKPSGGSRPSEGENEETQIKG